MQAETRQSSSGKNHTTSLNRGDWPPISINQQRPSGPTAGHRRLANLSPAKLTSQMPQDRLLGNPQNFGDLFAA